MLITSIAREHLEDRVFGLRAERLASNGLNDSVYFYRAASDGCDYVVEKAGKANLLKQVTSDCCDYGVVAVDRRSKKSYWFAGKNRQNVFAQFVRDEDIRPDLPKPYSFLSLYRELVWGESEGDDISSLTQLRDLVEHNFQSAYSPYERDHVWEKKFGFTGFELTVPRREPPPKGTPAIYRWGMLVKAEGTVERLGQKVIYAGR